MAQGVAAAIDARVLSSMRDERIRASAILPGPAVGSASLDKKELVGAVHDALYAAKICAYAQGMALIGAGSSAHSWGILSREMARIWKGGCIIRARFLDTIFRAYEKNAALPNLLLDETVRGEMDRLQSNWRKVMGLAAAHGVPVPAMSASLAYYDSYRAMKLPQNLTQAQRDAFGAHTYERLDDPGRAVHTNWLG